MWISPTYHLFPGVLLDKWTIAENADSSYLKAQGIVSLVDSYLLAEAYVRLGRIGCILESTTLVMSALSAQV